MGTIGLLVAVAPFFGVILLGWAAARTRTISETGAKDISTFAFVFATPCLLFRTMAWQPIDTLLDAGFVAAFLLAEAVVFVAVAVVGWFVFRRSLAGCVVMGFGSSFTNALLLGLPMLLAIGGERAGAFVLLIVALDSMILLPLSMVAIELAKAIDQRTGRRQGVMLVGPRQVLAATFRGLVRNPLVLGIVTGAAWGATGWILPEPADRALLMLGLAGPPCGLFALGAALAFNREGGQAPPAGAVVAAKLVVHPLLFFAIAHWIIGLDPWTTAIGTLIAALPVGQSVFITARRYDAAVGIASKSVAISTALALLTLTALLAVFRSFDWV